MAKLTAPLLSVGARGQFAKTIVYSVWKGIKYARQYVVPANPNSTAQQAQRTKFATGATFWNALAAAETAAWTLAASVAGVAKTGYNLCMESALTAQGFAAADQALCDDSSVADGGAGTIQADCYMALLSTLADANACNAIEMDVTDTVTSAKATESLSFQSAGQYSSPGHDTYTIGNPLQVQFFNTDVTSGVRIPVSGVYELTLA